MLSYCDQPKHVCIKNVNAIIMPLLYGVTRPIKPPNKVIPHHAVMRVYFQ